MFSSLCLFAQDDDPALINITTLEQLDAMRYDMDGDGVVDDNRGDPATSEEQSAYDAALTAYAAVFGTSSCSGNCTGYELMANLDFAGTKWAENATGPDAVAEGWVPIGDFSNRFTAVFEGNGHTISNLYINRTAAFVGLFGYLGSDGEVRNLWIKGGV